MTRVEQGLDTRAVRDAMVASQLRPTSVDDVRVVAAMARVPRERYLPGGNTVYRDTAVPLGRGRAANTPLATGRLLVAARLRPSDRVLLIGAASGYTAALLAELVATVVAVEVDPELAETARAALADLPNVTVVAGPLEAGHADSAPYDALVIDGAVEQLPDTLATQLVPDGRIATGLIERGVTRLAAGRRSEGGVGLAAFADLDCVVLPGFAAPRAFSFAK